MQSNDITGSIAASAPFDFRLSNRFNQTVLYLGVPQQDMKLELHNTSRSQLTIVASQRVPATKPTEHDCHFQLRFRPGTLCSPQDVKLDDKDWEMSYPQQPSATAATSASERSDDAVFYLRYEGTTPLTLDPDHKKSLSLRDIAVDGRSGSHNTRVELKYQQLQSAGNDKPLSGTCTHYVSVLNEGEEGYYETFW